MTMMVNKSNTNTSFIILNDSQIRDLVLAYNPNLEIQRIETLGIGLRNRIYLIRCRAEIDMVLRVLPDSVGAQQVRLENYLLPLLEQHQIPAPKLLRADASKDIIPYSYVLMERLPGMSLNRVFASMSEVSRARLYRQLGEYLGRLHQITCARFGQVVSVCDAAGGATGGYATWREMFTHLLRVQFVNLHGSIFTDLIPRLDAYFERHLHLLDLETPPRLLHMDCHHGNIFVDDQRVTGLLDFEESLIGHNEYELMRFEQAHFTDPASYQDRDIFLETYRQFTLLEDGYELRRPVYDLAHRLRHMAYILEREIAFGVTLGQESLALRQQVLLMLDESAKT